jgi:TP901 family phage tail tape measure protein
MTDRGGASLGTAEGRITVDTSQAVSSMNQLAGTMSSLDAKTQIGQSIDTFNQSVVGLAVGMQHLGRVGVGMGAAIAAPFALATKDAIAFESQMAGVNAVMDLQGSQFQDLSTLAQQLGRDTIFTGTEAAQGIETLGKAGIQAEDILNGAAEAATNLAAAGGTSVPAAADTIAAALNAYSLSGQEAAEVSDLLAGAANSSLASVSDLSLGFAQVGGVAAALGVPLEELITQLAIMTDMGLSGSDAATSIKTALNQLVAPIGQAAKEQARLGLSFRDSNGEFIGIKDTAELLIDTYDALGFSQGDIVESVKKLAGQDGYRALLFAMQEVRDEQEGGTKGWDEYARQVGETDAAQRLAEERMDSTAGSIERLMGSLATLREEFGAPMLGVIRPFVDALDALVDSLIGLPEPIRAVVTATGLLSGGITALGGAFLLVGGYVLEAIARFRSAGVNLTLIFGILGRIAIAATAAGAAIALAAVAFQNNWFGVRDLLEEILALLGEFGDDISEASQAAGRSPREVGKMEQGLYGIASALAQTRGPLKDFGQFLITNVIPAARAARDVFDEMLSHGVSPLVAGLKAASKFVDIFAGIGRGEEAVAWLDNAANRLHVFGDVFAEVRDSFGAQGINGITSALFGLSEAWEVAFGEGRIPLMLEDVGQIVDNLVSAFNIFREQGLNPVAAALGAIADTVAQELGMPGLAAEIANAANAAQAFGNAFREAQFLATIDGMTGLSAAIRGVTAGLQEAIGLDISGFTEPLVQGIESANRAWQEARIQGINPFNAGLDALNAFMETMLANSPRLSEMWSNFTEGVGGVAAEVQGLLGAGLDRVVQFFNELGTAISTGNFEGALTAVQSLISDITTELQSMGQRAIDWVINVGAPELIGWAQENVGNAGTWIREQLGLAEGFAGEVLGTVQGWVINVLTPTLTGWVDAAQAELGPRIQAAANFAGQVLATIQGWVINVLTPTIQGFTETAGATIESLIKEYLPKAGEVLGNVAGWVLEVGAPAIQETVEGGLDIAQQITDWVDEQIVFPNVNELPEIEAKAQAFGEDLAGKVVELIQSAMAGMFGGGAAGGGAGLKAGFGGTAALSKQFTQDLEANATETAGALVEGFLRGFATGIADAMGQDNLATFISEGDFEPLKQQVLSGLGDAMADLKTDMESSVQDSIEQFQGVFQGLLDFNEWLAKPPPGPLASGQGFGAGGMSIADQFNTNLDTMVNELVKIVKDAFGGLGTKFTEAMELPENPFDTLGTAISGWEDSIRSLFDGIGGAVAEAEQEFKLAKQNLERILAGEPILTQQESFELGTRTGVLSGIGFGAGYGEGIGTGTAEGFTTSQLENQGVIRVAAEDTLAAAAEEAEDGIFGAIGGIKDFLGGELEKSAIELGETLGTVSTRSITEGIPKGVVTELPHVGNAGLASARDIDKTYSVGLARAEFAETKDALADKLASVSTESAGQLDQASEGAADAGTNLGSALATALAGSVGRADFTAVGQALQAKIGTSLISGVQEGDTSAVAGAAGGLGQSIAQALAGQIGAADFAAVGQALQAKIGTSLIAGTAEGGTGAAGQVAGAAGGLGQSIAQAIAGQVGAADFTLVGQALQAKIGTSLVAGMAEGGGAQIAGAAGGLGQSLAQAIAGQVGTADFAAVGDAISSAIGASLGQATGNMQSAMQAVMQAVIAAGQQAASQAAQVGTVIGTNIAGAIAANTQPAAATQTMITAAVSAGMGAAAASAQIGTTFGTNVASAIAANTAPASATTTMVSAAISAGVGAAAAAAQIGQIMGDNVASAIAANTSAQGAMTTLVNAAIEAGVAAGAGAVRIGENIVAGIVAGINSGAGAVAGAVARIVAEGLAAGQAEADSQSPSKEAIKRIGLPIAQGVTVGIEEGTDDAVQAGRRLAEGALKGAEDAATSIRSLNAVGRDMEAIPGFTEFGNRVMEIASQMQEADRNVRNTAKDLIGNLRKTLQDGAKGVGRDAAALGSAVSSGMGAASSAGAGADIGRDQLRGARSIVGDLQKMKSDVRDLETLADDLDKIPGFHNFGEQVRELAGNIESNRTSALDSAKSLVKDIESAMREGARRMKEAANDIGTSISEGVATGTASATEEATSTAEQLTESITSSLNANLGRLPEMAEAMGTDVGTAVADGIQSTEPAVTEAATNVGDAATAGLESAEPAVEEAATGIVDAATTGMETAATEQSDFARQVGEIISSTFGEGFASGQDAGASVEMVKGYYDALRGAVESVVPQVRQASTEIGSAFSSGIDSINPTQEGRSLATEAATGIAEGTTTATGQANTSGTQIGNSLATGIDEACKTVNSNAADLTDSCVPKGIESGENHASGVAQDAGEHISESLVDGLDVKKKDVQRKFDDAGGLFGRAMGQGIGGTVGDSVNAAQNVANQAGNVDGHNDGKSVGVSIGQGIAAGVTSTIPAIRQAVEKAVQEGIDAAKKKSKSESPSLVFMEEGRNWVLGIEQGILRNLGLIVDASGRIVTASTNALSGAGVTAATRKFDVNMDRYTDRITDTIAWAERAVDASRLPKSMTHGIQPKPVGAGGGGAAQTEVKSVTINGVVIDKGHPAAKAAFDFVDALEQMSGQYGGA